MDLHEFIDDGSDPGNCSVCHFFHTDQRGPNGERPDSSGDCECLPGQVCDPCEGRGYTNGLAGYAARIHPERVTQDDIDQQGRVDRAAQA